MDGVLYDDDIKAQMQNAIDDLLALNGCDEAPSGVATAASARPEVNGDDLALNEAVNSIL